MLLFWFHIILSVTMFYFVLIANIQCEISWRRILFSYIIKTKKISPITVQEFLMNSNSSVTAVNPEVIASIKCNIIFTFWGLIPTVETMNISDIYGSILVLIFLLSNLYTRRWTRQYSILSNIYNTLVFI